MKTLMVVACCTAAILSAAEKAAPEPERPEGWKTIYFSYKHPCHIQSYNFFCCPIKKCVIVPKEKNTKIYYYYNRRDEIIGWRKENVGKDDDHTSVIIALGCNCTQCQQQKVLVHYWNNRWRTRMITPRRK